MPLIEGYSRKCAETDKGLIVCAVLFFFAIAWLASPAPSLAQSNPQTLYMQASRAAPGL